MTDKPEPTIDELKVQLQNAQEAWHKEYLLRRKQEKMLQACLEVIKHLQDRA